MTFYDLVDHDLGRNVEVGIAQASFALQIDSILYFKTHAETFQESHYEE